MHGHLNVKYRCKKIVFYYTPQHVSAVQITHHPVDVGYTSMT